MIRFALAMLGVLAVMVGHDAHSPITVTVGVAACLPVLVRVVTWPARSRSGFVLSAVVAGLVLAGFATHHAASAGTDRAPRPAPAVCVAGVRR